MCSSVGERDRPIWRRTCRRGIIRRLMRSSAARAITCFNRVSWSRKPSPYPYIFVARLPFRLRAANSGSLSKMAWISFSVSSHDFHAATHFDVQLFRLRSVSGSSISRTPRGKRTDADLETMRGYRSAVETQVFHISQRWLNPVFCPEAGRFSTASPAWRNHQQQLFGQLFDLFHIAGMRTPAGSLRAFSVHPVPA